MFLYELQPVSILSLISHLGWICGLYYSEQARFPTEVSYTFFLVVRFVYLLS